MMRIAIPLMLLIGLVCGFAIPVGRPHSAQAVAAAAVEGSEAPHDTVLTRAQNGHFYTYAEVNGHSLRFVVDTGATNVALTAADARAAGINVDPSQFEVVGTGASGAVRGMLVKLDKVELDGKRAHNLSAMVLPDLEISLLGQNFLQHVDSVQINGDSMTLR
jgi:aspartyl protease family protein